jgi:hypothetical protein
MYVRGYLQGSDNGRVITIERQSYGSYAPPGVKSIDEMSGNLLQTFVLRNDLRVS